KTEIITPLGKIQQIFMIANQGKELFITTNIGLIILNEHKKPTLFSLQQNGINGGDFTGVLPDNDFVWVCSDRTLGRLHTQTGKIIFLGEKEGLDNVQLYKRSLIKTSRQTIMIGSDQGYYEIFPENLQSIAHASKPFVTDFRVNDRSLPMPFFRQGERQIQLKYDENFFSFDLSSFDYEEAADIQYAYMLQGFDSEWQYTSNQRTGIYTNVPGGKYILPLKAKNSSGEWVENAEGLGLAVVRHFFNNWWFRGIIALIVGGLIFWLYKFRMKQVNKEADLRTDYEIKLNELENSALRTQMNPHFIFNSLNTINSFISLNETEQAHKYIAKFSRLIRYILDHSRQRKI